MQVNTLESANLNAETLAAMKRGAEALKSIHGKTNADTIANTMDEIMDQQAIADEISRTIAAPTEVIDDVRFLALLFPYWALF